MRRLGKSGHWIIGSLHLYTAAGRWFDTISGCRGRLNGCSMHSLVKRAWTAQPPSVEAGPRLCPEAVAKTQRMQDVYDRYETFMRFAREHARRYEQFMSNTVNTRPVKPILRPMEEPDPAVL